MHKWLDLVRASLDKGSFVDFRMRAIPFLAIICLGILSACDSSKDWGNCRTNIQAEFLPDGERIKLLAEASYVDQNGKVWIAPKGWVVDGASIPRAFWTVIGSPLTGKYRYASVFHDVVCDTHSASWEEAARMFYDAMRCCKVEDRTAKIMFAAVYHFGPHWPLPTSGGTPPYQPYALPSASPTPPVSQTQVDQIKNWIEKENPSLEEIERRGPR
jgi:hypothetical protein